MRRANNHSIRIRSADDHWTVQIADQFVDVITLVFEIVEHRSALGAPHVLAGFLECVVGLFQQTPQAVTPQSMVRFEEVGFLVGGPIVEIVLHDAIEFGSTHR